MSTASLDCGWIAVKASEVMEGLHPGEVLEIACESPEKGEDVELWLEMTGHELLTKETGEGWIYYYVKKKPGS
jgi:TusA-related sulfurtransferase